jgi:hypothetical protein
MNILKLRGLAALASFFALSHTVCSAASHQEFPFLETVSYNANNPIEDRFSYARLRSIDGFTASVFDGHGGDLTVSILPFSPNTPANISTNSSIAESAPT